MVPPDFTTFFAIMAGVGTRATHSVTLICAGPRLWLQL
jgi:hypothetical protein